MGTNGSFYQNGLPLSTLETGLGNVSPGAPVANKANASFYLGGSAYSTLMNSDALLAAITAQQVLATSDAAAALASQTAAALSQIAAAASVVTLGTTALLKGNNLGDLASVATAKVNLSLDQVNNTTDANKPVSTAQATADALVASNAAAATALKANIASPTLTGVPLAPTAAALTNNTQLATTAYADAATATLSGTVTTALALKAPLASPSLTGVPVAPTAAALTNTTQLATTAFVDAARVVLVAVDALKAPLASPALTGVPTAPTAAALNNTTQLATTAYADAAVSTLSGTVTTALGLKAPLASPTLTGTPAAPTAAALTSTTQIATTAFATAADAAILATANASLALKAPLASPALTGTPTVPTATVGTNTTQAASTAFVIANAASAGVSSIAGNSGAFTLSGGLTNSANAIKLALNNASLQAYPSNPLGTSSGTPGVMMGLGGVCTLTPTYSGRVQLTFTGLLACSTTAASRAQAYYGTGTAPLNGVAPTGTAVGGIGGTYSAVSTAGWTVTLTAVITGLTPGTPYWFDISVFANSAGTCSITNVSCSAVEF